MLHWNRAALGLLVLAALVGPSHGQTSKKPKVINRAALGKHRDAINNSTKDVTKETVEEAQARLDAAEKDLQTWMTEEDLKAEEKSLAALVRAIEKKQGELDQLRGSPPKRPEFQPFVGKWSSEHGTLSLNEFGRGSFVWLSKDKGNGGLQTTFSKAIKVAEDGKSFEHGAANMKATQNAVIKFGTDATTQQRDGIRFQLQDDGESLNVQVRLGRKVENYESDFTLKRTSKTPDPDEVEKPTKKKPN